MRKLIVTLVVLSFVSSALNARTRVFDTEVVCDKDSVTVSFKVDASGKVPVRMKEVIMPFVYNGKDTVWLEPLEIFGRDKYVPSRKRPKEIEQLQQHREQNGGQGQHTQDGHEGLGLGADDDGQNKKQHRSNGQIIAFSVFHGITSFLFSTFARRCAGRKGPCT